MNKIINTALFFNDTVQTPSGEHYNKRKHT